MTRWLGALILFWPLLEIAGLVWLAERIGLAATLALTGAGFLAGLFVLRQTGLQAVERLRLAMEMGESRAIRSSTPPVSPSPAFC